ncbi:MAG: minor capsid protein [Desulfovibrionaceae bacterium]|nr:minor capsid protein [Desulfovibrionaceae bacterium]MBF0513644.1 minor capsid protein [Desulfovibrionaceae bacterium]
MAEIPDLKAVFGLPPEKAIAFFRSKGLEITFDWHDVWKDAHAKAFTVAKCTRLDVLKDIRAALDKALAQGQTLAQFQKELTPVLQAKGWWGRQLVTDPRTGEQIKAELGSPRRLALIYSANMQTAYMAGRYREQLENADAQPWWMYVAVMDARTRPAHAAMNGQTFRYDDPFWAACYPPNGWNCRCRVRAMDGDTVKTKGVKPQSSAGRMSKDEVVVSRRTGEIRERTVYTDPKRDIRFSPDPGWDYNPATSWMQGMGPKLTDSLAQGPAGASQMALRELVKSDGFKSFLEKPEGLWPVLRLEEKAALAIKAQDPVAVLSAETLLKNQAAHPELTLEDYHILPDLGQPDLVIKDGPQTVVLIKRGDVWYHGVVKSTKTGLGTFVTSFRRTEAADVERIKRRGEILE